jgi:hypothetical protein
MALIRLDPNELILFIPRFERNNHKDPLTVHIKYVSAVCRDEYLRRMGLELKDAGTDLRKLEITRAHDKEMFCKQIVKIDNYVNADGSPIEDVAVFYESIDWALRSELLGAMEDQATLTAGQRKN